MLNSVVTTVFQKRAIRNAVLKIQTQKSLCQILQRLCNSTRNYVPQKEVNAVDRKIPQFQNNKETVGKSNAWPMKTFSK